MPWAQPRVQNWGCPARCIQISYYFNFMPHSDRTVEKGGCEVLSMISSTVGVCGTILLRMQLKELYEVYTKMTVKWFKNPIFLYGTAKKFGCRTPTSKILGASRHSRHPQWLRLYSMRQSCTTVDSTHGSGQQSCNSDVGL